VPIRLLAAGDMHLGRRPARLPDELAGEGRRYGPSAAWQRTVDQAIEHAVDIVALAGDVVEQEDDFFEAYRDLKAGVERLAAAGITVIGVSGNHDVQVLPRLAAEIQSFRLLGAGGDWEVFEFADGQARLTIHGWSFPHKQVRTSPLAGHRFERGEGIHLGLLHCDRDQRDSVYAPVTSGELAAAGLDGWLLGHIHRPDALTAPNPSGYLGSLSGLHPGEHGVRGPWLIEIEHGRIQRVEQWPLAPLQWQRMVLDLTGIEQPEDALGRLLREIETLEAELNRRHQPPLAVGLRIRLTGRTGLGGAVAEALSGEANVSGSHACVYFIESVIVATRPETDLAELAEREQGNYLGLLARRLQVLDGPAEDHERQRLIEGARRQLESTIDQPRWAGLDRPSMDDDQLADQLADTGIRLLEDLIRQRHPEAGQ